MVVDNDVLNELHAHTLPGAPGESDPFTLRELEREYIAYAPALYYQCEHCREYHGRTVARMGEAAAAPLWAWQADLIKLILFLRIAEHEVAKLEWEGWMQSWRHFAVRIHLRHPGLACCTAYAIGSEEKKPAMRRVLEQTAAGVAAAVPACMHGTDGS